MYKNNNFSVKIINKETEDYNYRIQNCISFLLDKVVLWRWKR